MGTLPPAFEAQMSEKVQPTWRTPRANRKHTSIWKKMPYLLINYLEVQKFALLGPDFCPSGGQQGQSGTTQALQASYTGLVFPSNGDGARRGMCKLR
jgi:hypothetical protein